VPCAASTQWHWAAVAFAPREQPAPACGELGLLGVTIDGEHLCRQCGNCGYGWAEACTPHGAGPRPAPVPILGVLAASLGAALACTGAGSFLSLLLGGAALAAAWLVLAFAISVALTIGYAALAGKERRR
jgi:hypothetical protein